jgi:hypothetical protein
VDNIRTDESIDFGARPACLFVKFAEYDLQHHQQVGRPTIFVIFEAKKEILV